MIEGIIYASYSSHTHPIHASLMGTMVFRKEKKREFHLSGITRKSMRKWQLSRWSGSILLGSTLDINAA